MCAFYLSGLRQTCVAWVSHSPTGMTSAMLVMRGIVKFSAAKSPSRSMHIIQQLLLSNDDLGGEAYPTVVCLNDHL